MAEILQTKQRAGARQGSHLRRKTEGRPMFMVHLPVKGVVVKNQVRCLVLLLAVVVHSMIARAQSPLALPGCEPAPGVRKDIDETFDEKKFEHMKYSEQTALRHELAEKLIAKYPREVEPYRRILNLSYGDAVWKAALQERFRKQATEHPEDPLALYAAGSLLHETDTPESFRLLELAKSKAPQFPWPALSLASGYSEGRRRDKEKAAENLSLFFASCPSSTVGWAHYLLGTSEDTGLQKRTAAAVRARLAKEADPARLKDYERLWSLEFRTRPLPEHNRVRRQVAEDLKRLDSLNPKPDAAWLAFLIQGSKLAGADPEAMTAAEDRLLKSYPKSEEALEILYDRWDKAHKKPDDPKDAAAWAKYDAAYREALQVWIREFPDDRELAGERWFYAVFDSDTVSQRDGLAAVDGYLQYASEYREPSFWVQFQAADFLMRRGWQPGRALDLLQDAKVESDRELATRSKNDNRPDNLQKQFDDQDADVTLRINGQILRAAALAGRPDAAKGLRSAIEGPLPSQEKLQSGYWWARARLAVLDGQKQDALAYYQQGLYTRQETPSYREGRLRDDLMDEAQTIWKESGGTTAAWVLWSKPPSSKASELAQGRWEAASKTLPAFELADLSGKTWRLKELEGKALLINVWATWCGPCNEELPSVQRLYDELRGRSDVQLLTFDFDEDLGLVAPFLKEKGYTFPVLPAYATVNDVLDGFIEIPQSWVVDPKGGWRWTQIGYGGESDWTQVMTKRLEAAKSGN